MRIEAKDMNDLADSNLIYSSFTLSSVPRGVTGDCVMKTMEQKRSVLLTWMKET